MMHVQQSMIHAKKSPIDKKIKNKITNG